MKDGIFRLLGILFLPFFFGCSVAGSSGSSSSGNSSSGMSGYIVTGTVTLPAGSFSGMTNYYVIATNTNINTSEPLSYTNKVIAGETALSFSLPGIPAGTYYIVACIDINGDGYVNNSDYVKYYGGTGVTPPASANATVSAVSTNFDITIGSGDHL